ncbi:cartilage intermediate layer protein 1 [Lampris incognitus]|uniref:cartilage intermediate layer protein 1 n=1 Tax=Lampris incognitus TaxID=2546036 RepID=UPI0024B5A98B|nr:cartilage intermediate layer protein 1 [Lampris incognitus]
MKLLLAAMFAGLHAERVLLATDMAESDPELDIEVNETIPVKPSAPSGGMAALDLEPDTDECWTGWFDRDDPTGSGDWETLSALQRENPGSICPRPLEIEVQTIYGRSMHETGDVIAVADANRGFICRNAHQRHKRRCDDYRVRFRCPISFCCEARPLCWTRWFNRDKPSGSGDWEHLVALRRKYKGEICDSPLRIDAVTADDMTPASSTGQTFHKYDVTSGFICRNKDQWRRRCLDYKVRFQCPCENIRLPY